VQRGDDWVNTKRFTNSAGNTTRVTRGDEGSMISRRGQNGSGFVGTKGDNVYAGRDGNVYRKDANGNWQKWDNGNWNSPTRPEQRSDARDSMLNDRARQQERTDRARGDGVGNSSSRPSQIDRGTVNSLERDRAARSSGSQRSRDFNNYNRSRSSGSSGNVGGYRGSSGGGGRGGGGGGFRGGGRRR
jgi:hypothetical protein